MGTIHTIKECYNNIDYIKLNPSSVGSVYIKKADKSPNATEVNTNQLQEYNDEIIEARKLKEENRKLNKESRRIYRSYILLIFTSILLLISLLYGIITFKYNKKIFLIALITGVIGFMITAYSHGPIYLLINPFSGFLVEFNQEFFNDFYKSYYINLHALINSVMYFLFAIAIANPTGSHYAENYIQENDRKLFKIGKWIRKFILWSISAVVLLSAAFIAMSIFGLAGDI